MLRYAAPAFALGLSLIMLLGIDAAAEEDDEDANPPLSLNFSNALIRKCFDGGVLEVSVDPVDGGWGRPTIGSDVRQPDEGRPCKYGLGSHQVNAWGKPGAPPYPGFTAVTLDGCDTHRANGGGCYRWSNPYKGPIKTDPDTDRILNERVDPADREILYEGVQWVLQISCVAASQGGEATGCGALDGDTGYTTIVIKTDGSSRILTDGVWRRGPSVIQRVVTEAPVDYVAPGYSPPSQQQQQSAPPVRVPAQPDATPEPTAEPEIIVIVDPPPEKQEQQVVSIVVVEPPEESAPDPTPEPTPAPTPEPTPAPTPEPTPTPTPAPPSAECEAARTAEQDARAGRDAAIDRIMRIPRGPEQEQAAREWNQNLRDLASARRAACG